MDLIWSNPLWTWHPFGVFKWVSLLIYRLVVNNNPGTFTTAIGPVGVFLKIKGSLSHDDDWMIWGYPHDFGNLQKQKDPTIEQNTEQIWSVRGFTAFYAFLVIYLPLKAGRTAPRCSKQLVFLSRWCLSQSHGHKFEWILMCNMLAYTWQVVTGIGSVSWHPSTAESRSDLADFQWNTSTTTLFTWRVATFNS